MKTPGPGAYSAISPDMSKYSRSSRVVFGTGQRETTRMTTVPGPGQYAPQDHSTSPRFGFGTAKRQPLAGKTGTPGPGAYSKMSVIGAEGAKYSVTGRRAEQDRMTNVPGPGTYQPNDSSRAGVDKQPTWSFGTSPRAGIVSGTSGPSPGPGAYESKNMMGAAPAYSIKARREINNKMNITPGPGAHGGMYTQFGY